MACGDMAKRCLSTALIAGAVVAVAYLIAGDRARSRRIQIGRKSKHVIASLSHEPERWPEEPPPDVDSEVALGPVVSHA